MTTFNGSSQLDTDRAPTDQEVATVANMVRGDEDLEKALGFGWYTGHNTGRHYHRSVNRRPLFRLAP